MVRRSEDLSWDFFKALKAADFAKNRMFLYRTVSKTFRMPKEEDLPRTAAPVSRTLSNKVVSVGWYGPILRFLMWAKNQMYVGK